MVAGAGISSNLVGPGAMVSPQPGMQIPVVIVVDQNGAFAGTGSSGSPTVIRIQDATTTTNAVVLTSGAQLVSKGVVTSQTSLNAVTANGNGTVVDLGSAYSNISFVVSTTGTPTGGTVTLSVSVDNTVFVATATTASVGTNPTTSSLGNVAYRYVRLDLTGLTGGASPTVTAKVMGS